MAKRREKSRLMGVLIGGVIVLCGFLLAACGGGGTPGPTASEPAAQATETPTPIPSPTFTPTPLPSETPTPSPTPGPGLEELIGTPEALAAAAELEGAWEAYEQLATLYPQRAAPLLGQAALAQREGDVETALEALRAAVTLEPDNEEALRQFSLLLEQQGEYGELVGVYDRMIALRPDDPGLLVARAMAHARLGHAEEAVADLEAAQALDPYREYAWLNVAAAASGQRQYETAIQIASAGLTFYPEAGRLYLTRGLAYLSLGEAEAALDDFEAAVALDDLDYTAYHWQGRALAELGRTEEAIASLQRAGELGADSGVAGLNEAFEAMAAAADLMAISDPQAAFSYLAEQVFRFGSVDGLLMGYGLIEMRRGNDTLAFIRMNSLAEGGYVPALYWRAVLYERDGERAEAIEDLRAFLEVRRYGPDAEAARALLESLGGTGD